MDEVEKATIDITIAAPTYLSTESYTIEQKNVSQVRALLMEFANRYEAAQD